MSNDVPTKPGYYRDFEGDIWRLEDEGVNNWTLRPGGSTEERNVGDFWRYQPMYEIPAPAGLPEVAYRLEIKKKDGGWYKLVEVPTLSEAEELKAEYYIPEREYRILRIETTEVAS